MTNYEFFRLHRRMELKTCDYNIAMRPKASDLPAKPVCATRALPLTDDEVADIFASVGVRA